MLLMSWLQTHLPNGTIMGGMERVNSLYWNISLEEDGQQCRVKAGDKSILVTDSRECMDAFLYGLTLAYAVIPTEIFEQLQQEIRKVVE